MNVIELLNETPRSEANSDPGGTNHRDARLHRRMSQALTAEMRFWGGGVRLIAACSSSPHPWTVFMTSRYHGAQSSPASG